jgi:hypothetical protein
MFVLVSHVSGVRRVSLTRSEQRSAAVVLWPQAKAFGLERRRAGSRGHARSSAGENPQAGVGER